jgi:uncharacterized cupin superfamily protein
MNEPTDNDLRTKLIRNVADVVLERQHRPPLYDTQCGSLTHGSAAVKLGAGYDVLAPGKRGCPYHLHHAQEEMFVILEGTGTLRVAGQLLPVRTGDVVTIPPGPDYPHQFINTSDAPLRYISISTKEVPEICEYPDSGKYAAYKGEFRASQRIAANLDYWDGEA